MTIQEAARVLGITVRRLHQILGTLHPGWQRDWPVSERVVRELYGRLTVHL